MTCLFTLSKGETCMRTSTGTTAKERRRHQLRSTLEVHGRELVVEVLGKIRDARGDRSKEREVMDEAETCEVDVQTEIDFALLELKAETLNAIDAAVSRIEEGTYGYCIDCSREIHGARLRALPFARRCKACEEVRESAARSARVAASRRASSTFFPDYQTGR